MLHRLAALAATVLLSVSLYAQVKLAIPGIATTQATPFPPRLSALASAGLLLALGLARVHRRARSASD